MRRRRLAAASKDWTVAEVIAEIRARSEAIDKLHAVYVIDPARRLIGYLKIRDLLLAPAEAKVGEIARLDPVAVLAGADRQEVARLAREERLKAVPVVERRAGCSGSSPRSRCSPSSGRRRPRT